MIKKFSALLVSTFKPDLFRLVMASLIIVCLVITEITLTIYQPVFAENKTPTNILVLGDSLSGAYGINMNEGWVALLQHKLNNEGYDFNVINVSVSGDTTRTGLSRIDNALKNHKPKIVIIALGGNDGLRGLAMSEIKASLSSIIERCNTDKTKILLVGVRLPPNYGPAYNQQFAEVYRELAKRYDIPLVPRMLGQVAEHRELMQQDGIHPKAQAQAIVLKNIWAGLKLILK